MTDRLKLALVALVVLSGCGGGATEESTIAEDTVLDTTTTVAQMTTATAPATTTTAAPTTTTVSGSEGMIPDPATGVTLVPYSDENITAGDVFLYWYRDTAEGNYLVLYAGPGIAGAEGLALCPGNSIAAPDFIHVSNTPVEEGSCDGFPTATASVQICSGDVWIYETAIPGDLEGTLYGSLEWNSSGGTIKGLTGQLATTPDMPEFEYGLSSYALWDGFTSDGSSHVTCSPPTS